MSATEAHADVQVLEFSLGEETYCVEIEYITEIVDRGETTPIPKTPDHVAGVMDLRGRTTTIVDPRILLNDANTAPGDAITDGGTSGSRIVVFDPDSVEIDGAMGWIVSRVAEVTHISEENVERDPVSDIDHFRGIVKRDDDFLIWIDPDRTSLA